jgi:hypothetical protein
MYTDRTRRRVAPRTRLSAGSLLALSAVVLWGVIASSASAAVPGLQRVQAASALDSLPSKFVTATCPAGQQLIGTGSDINGAAGNVVIDDQTPNAGLTAVTVNAFEDDDGTAANWSVTATAICANPLGAQRVTVSSGLDSNNKGVAVACPNGTQLLGTGFDVTGSLGEVYTSGLEPNALLTSVTASAFEDETGEMNDWTLRGYGICAPNPGGLVRVFAASISSSSDKSVVANCPGNKVAVGNGHQLATANGQVLIGKDAPNAGLTANTVTGFEDDTGTNLQWVIRSYVICATP